MTTRTVPLSNGQSLTLEVSKGKHVSKRDSDSDWEHVEYRYRITYQGRTFRETYSQGMSWPIDEVQSKDVIATVALDYLTTTSEGFEDFADDFGYDRDSLKAYRLYERLIEEQKRLVKLFGGIAEADSILRPFAEEN